MIGGGGQGGGFLHALILHFIVHGELTEGIIDTYTAIYGVNILLALHVLSLLYVKQMYLSPDFCCIHESLSFMALFDARTANGNELLGKSGTTHISCRTWDRCLCHLVPCKKKVKEYRGGGWS